MEPHHAELVASKWTLSQSPNKTSWIEKRILNYQSAAVFPEEDPSQPVAWAMQYQNREIGTLYTMEAHRRRGLGLAVMASLCRSLFEDSPPNIPLCCGVIVGETISAKLVEKLGFLSLSLIYYLNVVSDTVV